MNSTQAWFGGFAYALLFITVFPPPSQRVSAIGFMTMAAIFCVSLVIT